MSELIVDNVAQALVPAGSTLVSRLSAARTQRRDESRRCRHECLGHVSHYGTGFLFAALFSATLWAQLPDGPGREETERICKNCHELARSISLRQDKAGWQTTLAKMVALGTK